MTLEILNAKLQNQLTDLLIEIKFQVTALEALHNEVCLNGALSVQSIKEDDGKITQLMEEISAIGGDALMALNTFHLIRETAGMASTPTG